MNILYHHRTQMQGGEGSHIRGIINAFRQLGHQVIIFSPFGTQSKYEIIHDSRHLILQRIYKLISELLPHIFFELMEIGYNFHAHRKIWNLTKHEKIDFIYERYALYGISGIRIAEKLNIPIVLEVNMISDLNDNRPIKMKWLARKFENSILNHADAIVTVSNFLKCQMVSNGINEQKIWVIPNGVNLDEFNKGNGIAIRREYNLEDSFIIGFVGNLSTLWYGLDVLVETLSDIATSNINKIHLLLVGKAALDSELYKLIERHNFDRYVTITGWIEHDEIPDYISAMDVAVLADSSPWASPIKMFEYMVMGKPVIAPAYEPIEEIITSRENGILFKPGDYNELKQAILTLMNDEKLREKIGNNARETVIKNHTWIKNAEKILEIYETLKAPIKRSMTINAVNSEQNKNV